MSGEAGLTLVSVCTRPQSQFLVSVPLALASVAKAVASAVTTCVPQVFAVFTLASLFTSSQNECWVRSGRSFTTSARISAPVSPLNDWPVEAETTLKSSSKTLWVSMFRKVWKSRHAAELVSVGTSVTAALFGSEVVSPVGQSYAGGLVVPVAAQAWSNWRAAVYAG